MGDLAVDTAVEAVGAGRFRCVLSRDWEIWGPMGGYVAAVALRAVGAHLGPDHPARPVAFSCHYLGVARFEAVDIAVVALREGRGASSYRVSITQGDRPILEALVWASASTDGLEHDETVAPAVPGPGALPSLRELLPPDAEPPFPFWENFDPKPVTFEVDWPPDGPREAIWQEWLRFLPTPTWDDPWVDGGRTLILVDLPSWPAAQRVHAWTNPPWMAPTLDLNVAFHRSTSDHEWLLCDGVAPVSTAGLFGWTGKVWSDAGQLLASGGGQCLYRPMPNA